MTLDRYLRHRRLYEALIWTGFLTLNWLANVWVIWLDVARAGAELERWKPLVWEGTSFLMILLLVPLIVVADRRFSLGRQGLRRAVAAHLLFSVLFSVLHVIGMVALRHLIYSLLGHHYQWGAWPWEFGYEYLKDFRTYWTIIAILYLYRFVLRRLRGEAGFLQQGREDLEAEPVTDRFLVKKLGREFLVKVEDIDWIEAAGNYVNLHVGKRIYPLRDTMTAIETRLTGQGFLRVHRSAILNLDRVQHITPFDTGDGEATLATGVVVPVSRTYRKQLRERLV